MAGLALIGIAAFPFLPVAPLPQVDFPTILVSAQLPGASPDIMATSVAQPLETQFAQIPGVAQMTSSSVLGGTQITLQFDLDRNIDAAARRRPGGHQRRRRPAAEEPALAPLLPQGTTRRTPRSSSSRCTRTCCR